MFRKTPWRQTTILSFFFVYVPFMYCHTYMVIFTLQTDTQIIETWLFLNLGSNSICKQLGVNNCLHCKDFRHTWSSSSRTAGWCFNSVRKCKLFFRIEYRGYISTRDGWSREKSPRLVTIRALLHWCCFHNSRVAFAADNGKATLHCD